MQIHMVIKSEKVYDETVTYNIQPYASKASAERRAEIENSKLKMKDFDNYVDYYVSSYTVEA